MRGMPHSRMHDATWNIWLQLLNNSNALPHLVGRLHCRLTLAAADLANMANTAGLKPYELQVMVVNYLGASSTASTKFDKVSAGQAPVISVAGGQGQTFKISEGIKLTAQLQATSVCAGKKVREVAATPGQSYFQKSRPACLMQPSRFMGTGSDAGLNSLLSTVQQIQKNLL